MQNVTNIMKVAPLAGYLHLLFVVFSVFTLPLYPVFQWICVMSCHLFLYHCIIIFSLSFHFSFEMLTLIILAQYNRTFCNNERLSQELLFLNFVSQHLAHFKKPNDPEHSHTL